MMMMRKENSEVAMKAEDEILKMILVLMGSVFCHGSTD